MGFFSNVKKKDEKDIKKAYSPTSAQSKAVEAKGGGKASGKNIEKPEGSDSFSDAQMKRMTASRNDNSWGYYDTNTGTYVPWYIDAQDGGGKNQSGDTFQGAGLYSAVLNAAGVAPYGYNQPRTYARAGMVGRPELPQPPASTPTNTPATPVVDNTPYGDAGFYDGMTVKRPVPPAYGYTPSYASMLGNMPMPDYTPYGDAGFYADANGIQSGGQQQATQTMQRHSEYMAYRNTTPQPVTYEQWLTGMR